MRRKEPRIPVNSGAKLKMEEKLNQKVMKILSDWNPLGDDATSVPDLDGYRTEAIDILFHVNLRSKKSNILDIVRNVLNQAFDLTLDKSECVKPEKQIEEILKKNK